MQYIVKRKNLGEDVELAGAFCMGKCAEKGVSVTVNDQFYSVDPAKVEEFFDDVIVKALNA